MFVGQVINTCRSKTKPLIYEKTVNMIISCKVISYCSVCFVSFLAKNQVVRFEPEPEEARASQKIGAVILVCMTFVFLPIMISDVPSIVNALKDNQMIVRVRRRRYSRN